jgi:hypothetical protein
LRLIDLHITIPLQQIETEGIQKRKRTKSWSERPSQISASLKSPPMNGIVDIHEIKTPYILSNHWIIEQKRYCNRSSFS